MRAPWTDLIYVIMAAQHNFSSHIMQHTIDISCENWISTFMVCPKTHEKLFLTLTGKMCKFIGFFVTLLPPLSSLEYQMYDYVIHHFKFLCLTQACLYRTFLFSFCKLTKFSRRKKSWYEKFFMQPSWNFSSSLKTI